MKRSAWLAALLAVIAASELGSYAVFGGKSQHPSSVRVFKNGVLTSLPEQTLVLLIDVSNSMRATDIRPTRLKATVAATRALLDRLPQRFEVGLVTFGKTARVIQAPTRDRQLVRRALSSLRPSGAMSAGDGLPVAVKLTVSSLAKEGVRRAPGGRLPALIVLETDGTQPYFTPPLPAARRAAAAGIQVDGVALGTRHGRLVDNVGLGQVIPVPSDPQAVARFTRITGGSAFTALSASRLVAVNRELGETTGR
jgi:Ca-activated chloride channel family protein